MRLYVRDKLITTLLIIWGAVTLAFLMLRILPGDAVTNQLIQIGASPEAITQQRAVLGLDEPLAVQYLRYLLNLLHGDLGYSYLSRQPVSRLILEQFAPTLVLSGSALIVAIVTGFTLGTVGILWQARWPGRIANAISVLALSTPIYWTGTISIYVFSSLLGWLPATGSGSVAHLLLPVLVLGFHVAGSIARITKTSVQTTLNAHFVRTAYAKGLRPAQIFLTHVIRPSLPPIVSIIALQTGFLLGGTVITEMIFARQGIGQLLQHAVLDQDYPVVMGVVVLAAVTYSLVTTLADLAHGLLDPRIRPVEGA
jgi:peptide/nickel transport system permease protein